MEGINEIICCWAVEEHIKPPG